MGYKTSLGEHCNSAEIDFNLTLLYGELRAGHFSRRTGIAVSDTATVAYSQDLCRIIKC